MMNDDLSDFCKSLPKIELHAHLNGSLSKETMKCLGSKETDILMYQKLSLILDQNERSLDVCFQLFKYAQELTSNASALYTATLNVIEDFHKDNVMYLELRTTPRCTKDLTKEGYIETVIRAIKDNKFPILVKLLISINRQDDAPSAEETLTVTIKMKEKYPNILKGLDLSGNPFIGTFNPKLFQKARDHKLHVVLHCGEIKNDQEVEDMLMFRPDRIGHGTFVHPKFGGCDKNWELLRQLEIPTEICLTSNVLCATTGSYQKHHVKEWIKHKVPFVLSTDDKGVFCTSLSQEIIIAAKNFSLTKQDIWNLMDNAVTYTLTTSEEKETLKRLLKEWKEKTLC